MSSCVSEVSTMAGQTNRPSLFGHRLENRRYDTLKRAVFRAARHNSGGRPVRQ